MAMGSHGGFELASCVLHQDLGSDLGRASSSVPHTQWHNCDVYFVQEDRDHHANFPDIREIDLPYEFAATRVDLLLLLRALARAPQN